ncbi:caspase family protein [Curvibacter gracilis]|uniref:caspase family protein n=1 Tax=Curvibacter gracilis TaxID=230310 RepID=UPI0004833549|nr:caspase family protein [Curvibacter gracilis]
MPPRRLPSLWACLLASLLPLGHAGSETVPAQPRALAGNSSRHALIISISRFADPRMSPLPGAAEDRKSATEIARAMQVPDSNITYLQDEQATGDNIRRALAALNTRVQDGDRVFVHYSGHGTRFPDPETGGCAEALSTHDGGTWKGIVLHKEMAQLLQPIVRKTDKLFVMYDACHSGGLLSQLPKPRSTGGDRGEVAGENTLRGRFAETSESCARPSNVRTRSLLDEATAQGALPQDVVFLSAARPDEVSLEDQKKGGLATQFVRDCLLREAVDLDGSGAISMDEIQQCAQSKINQRLKNDSLFTPHHLLLSGNRKFVPAWFSQALPTQQVPGAPTTGVLNAVAQTPPVTPPAATPALPPAALAPPQTPVAAPVRLTGAQALAQLYEQRDGKRQVRARLGQGTLRIGQDALDLAVLSDRSGYVYVALAGSDNQSLTLLFPNELDSNNRIEKDQQLLLPRPNWPVKAAGPAGTDTLLVMVADAPRHWKALPKDPGSPFARSLNDLQGRARLGALLGHAAAGACRPQAGQACSDAYGAVLVTVEEKP